MFKIPFLSEYFICKFKRNPTDDFADFLNYIFTPILLAICAILISAKQYFGSPIQCLLPSHFNSAWKEYSEEYCFTQKTYVPETNSENIINGIRSNDEIHYYQWLPLILVKQAIYFYFPCLIIKYFYSRSINVKSIIEEFSLLRNVQKNERRSKLNTIVGQLKEDVELEKEFNSFPRILVFLNFTSIFNNGFIFVLVKIICFLNVLIQFLFLTLLLGKMRIFWGFDVLHSLLYDEDSGKFFPRMTFCDMRVLELGNPHDYTFQCLLTINILNEKIFMCIYFYLIFLIVLNFFYIIKTLISYNLVNRQIDLSIKCHNPIEVEHFKKAYNSDYRLMTHFILNNFGIHFAHEFINELFILHQNTV